MPYRKTPLVTGEFYHVFNRSIARQPIFLGSQYYQRGIELIDFYNNHNLSLRFSHYNRLALQEKLSFMDNLRAKNEKQVMLLAFCLMSNHVHFLMKEIHKGGITTFMRIFQNSYAKYFNLKTDRNGSVFQPMFKAVRIETDEQLLHVARYIHLNPLTAYILKTIDELAHYPWSSYSIYVGNKTSELIEKSFILDYYPTIDKFTEFTRDQINYQRKLDKIKHLMLE